MAKLTAALKTDEETGRRHQRYDRVAASLRLRQRPRLRLVAALAADRGREVTVLACRGDQRFEVHREVTAIGRLRWFAVEIRGDALHDVRPAQRRWEAVAICDDWMARAN